MVRVPSGDFAVRTGMTPGTDSEDNVRATGSHTGGGDNTFAIDLSGLSGSPLYVVKVHISAPSFTAGTQVAKLYHGSVAAGNLKGETYVVHGQPIELKVPKTMSGTTANVVITSTEASSVFITATVHYNSTS